MKKEPKVAPARCQRSGTDRAFSGNSEEGGGQGRHFWKSGEVTFKDGENGR